MFLTIFLHVTSNKFSYIFNTFIFKVRLINPQFILGESPSILDQARDIRLRHIHLLDLKWCIYFDKFFIPRRECISRTNVRVWTRGKIEYRRRRARRKGWITRLHLKLSKSSVFVTLRSYLCYSRLAAFCRIYLFIQIVRAFTNCSRILSKFGYVW